jgi:hypothetical protein
MKINKSLKNKKMEELISIWNNYIYGRQQLMDNNLIRTFNNPVEDFSEWLVAYCINGQLSINVNQRDYDVETNNKYIQVKSIAKAPNNTNGYFVTRKDRENKLATHYAFVFFVNYSPTNIYVVNADYVRNHPKSQIKQEYLYKICTGVKDIGAVTVRHQPGE